MRWWWLIPLVALVLAGLAERAAHARRLRRIPVRILVNGTRGKTSVTRLIAAALNAGGVRAVAKCTGSDPREILPDGTERTTPRPHGARITELFGFVRRALSHEAQAIVVECMAVLPETQRALSRHLVQPTIIVMTNAVVDHVDELGADERETAQGLAFSLYPGAVLVTAEQFFADWPQVVPPDRDQLPDGYLDRFSFPAFEHNVRLALAVAALAGVDREDALRGMPLAQPDIGMAGPFEVGDSLIVNAFAANDPASTQARYELALPQMAARGQVVVLYNHRADRIYRLKGFLPFLRGALAHGAQLLVTGEDAASAARYFGRQLSCPCDVVPPARLTDAAFYAPRQAIFCVGNIKGAGADMIHYCMDQQKEPCHADGHLS